MTYRLVLALLIAAVFFNGVLGKVDLCITDISAYECGARTRGRAYHGQYSGTSQLVINTDQISVANPVTGARIDVVEVPGRYRMTFNNVKVKQNMTYLMADMELTLEPSGFDFPIQILNETCDRESHYVGPRGSNFCRYCDLCDIAERLDKKLERKNVFNRAPQSTQWKGTCQKLTTGRTYTWSRYINLPNPSNFQERYGTDIGQLLKEGLAGGEGTIIAKLRMLSLKSDDSSDTPSREQTPGSRRRELLTGRSSIGRSTGRSGQSRCFDDCLLDSPASVCVTRCSEQRKRDRERETRNKIAIEGPKCKQSSFYNHNYALAACYNVEFKFKATLRPPGFFSRAQCKK